ncbi:uncharacterized protein TOT_030000095 [Theileria orientalis strain Shintoku]|uniref:CBS domain-containing protein n=1 Tax=Theileria orientalis strain Shintoku TaxID=869250 RepID=J4C8I2_THEOR|nr:uncharacterized protein TOT_030000095 [Theileria orientalis strain Shintoku]PVC49985.1 hypothetical protein MACL_00002649 [Theileria orientalis]BAM40833.1 uncharacterized protein TOT_030000095 [Theileria orientalis strain Shintoku]|eukprot:XP_009691134.1 uncharacterized protein TOT_030000095 [Theileria orientalis strain Shintoku]
MNVDASFGDDLGHVHDYNNSSDTQVQSNFFSNFLRLLKSTSLCNILQSHSKILVVDSRVPFNICLKSLSNYHRNFAFVYDSEKADFAGYIDELSIIKLLKNYDRYINLTCSEFLSVVEAENVQKLPGDVTAFEGLDFITKNVSNRLFVWSNERKAPIGYLTPSCYLYYMVKNLRGKCDLLDLPLSGLTINLDFTTISYKNSLEEVLDLLILHDNLCVTDEKGRIIGILTRVKVMFYALEAFKNEIYLDCSTEVGVILEEMDSKFYHKIQPLHVESTTPLRKAVVSLLLSNDRVLVYTDA